MTEAKEETSLGPEAGTQVADPAECEGPTHPLVPCNEEESVDEQHQSKKLPSNVELDRSAPAAALDETEVEDETDDEEEEAQEAQKAKAWAFVMNELSEERKHVPGSLADVLRQVIEEKLHHENPAMRQSGMRVQSALRGLEDEYRVFSSAATAPHVEEDK